MTETRAIDSRRGAICELTIVEDLECRAVGNRARHSKVHAGQPRAFDAGARFEDRTGVITLGWDGDAAEQGLIKRGQSTPVSRDKIRVDVSGACDQRATATAFSNPSSLSTASILAFDSGFGGTIGRRYTSSSRPIAAIAALTGPGFDSTKFACMSGRIRA